MSLFKSITSGLSKVPGIGAIAGTLGTAAAGAVGGLFGGGKKNTVPVGPMPLQPAGASALAGRVVGPLGGVISGAVGGALGELAGNFLPRLSPGGSSSGGCGCNGSSGRDPCTRQRMTSQPAPLATFFGGCCPPGRTLRRINNGRDICIRTPRINVFNPAALARADRRITGFVRRAAPILKDMGWDVSRHRKPVSLGKKRRARR